MKRLIFLLFGMHIVILSYACKCEQVSFISELSNTQNIIVGKVLSQEKNNFSVKIIKSWKSATPKQDSVILVQFSNDCNQFLLLPNQFYILFFNENSVHQCSRSSIYRDFEYIEDLDSIYNENNTIDGSYKQTIDSLEFAKKFIIVTNDGPIIKKDKNILYYLKNRIIDEPDIPKKANWFYAVKYYHITDNIEIGEVFYDHVLYVTQEHQDMIWSEERKNKLIRKIRRKLKEN